MKARNERREGDVNGERERKRDEEDEERERSK